MIPPDYEEEGVGDWDAALAMQDDAFWSYFAFVAPFRWQTFLNWWVARRYVQPRDVRRR